MRVIFLDIDGVLNTYMKFSSNGNFSKIACDNLQYILNQVPDAQIVVSSSWRTYGVEALRDILKDNGIDSGRVMDVTEARHERHHSLDREHHIQRWLRSHPNVINYTIIDDEMEMPDLKSKYVHTNGYIGLTKRDSDLAIEILNNKDNLH